MGKAAVSQEEIQLRKRARRRLVGAAFLVLVMVVVLPLLLDAEPRPQAEAVRVRMPTPQPEVDDPAPLRAPAKAAPGLSGADAPRPESATPKDATPNGVTPREAPPSIADVPPPDPEAAPAPKKAAPPATVDPSPAMQQASVQAEASQSAKPVEGADDDALKPPVVIQLGAYIKAENAQQLKADLQAKRIKAYTEAVAFGATTKTRVRAGPYDSLAEAEKVRVRIEKMNLKLGMAPKIVPQGQ